MLIIDTGKKKIESGMKMFIELMYHWLVTSHCHKKGLKLVKDFGANS